MVRLKGPNRQPSLGWNIDLQGQNTPQICYVGISTIQVSIAAHWEQRAAPINTIGPFSGATVYVLSLKHVYGSYLESLAFVSTSRYWATALLLVTRAGAPQTRSLSPSPTQRHHLHAPILRFIRFCASRSVSALIPRPQKFTA